MKKIILALALVATPVLAMEHLNTSEKPSMKLKPSADQRAHDLAKDAQKPQKSAIVKLAAAHPRREVIIEGSPESDAIKAAKFELAD